MWSVVVESPGKATSSEPPWHYAALHNSYRRNLHTLLQMSVTVGVLRRVVHCVLLGISVRPMYIQC